MIDLSQVRTFVEVAERGTVAAAALTLSYSGPGVSQHLAKLEAELGHPLFDRVGGRLRLNARGSQFLSMGQRMLDLEEEARRSTTVATDDRPLVIAGFASAIRALVLPLLSAARPSNEPLLDVREAEDDAALRDLGLGHVDVAIVQEYDGLRPQHNARFTYTTLLRDRLRLVTSARHRRSVTLADLAGRGWLTNGAGTRCEEATALVLARAGIAPEVVGYIADNHTLLALVAAGHGSTIVPELVLADAPKGLTIATEDLRVKRTVLAVTRKATTKGHRGLLQALHGSGRSQALHGSARSTAG